MYRTLTSVEVGINQYQRCKYQRMPFQSPCVSSRYQHAHRSVVFPDSVVIRHRCTNIAPFSVKQILMRIICLARVKQFHIPPQMLHGLWHNGINRYLPSFPSTFNVGRSGELLQSEVLILEDISHFTSGSLCVRSISHGVKSRFKSCI